MYLVAIEYGKYKDVDDVRVIVQLGTRYEDV